VEWQPLEGTDRQVEWANRVRGRVADRLQIYVQRMPEMPEIERSLFGMAYNYLKNRRDAGFWISRSDNKTEEFLVDAVTKKCEELWKR